MRLTLYHASVKKERRVSWCWVLIVGTFTLTMRAESVLSVSYYKTCACHVCVQCHVRAHCCMCMHKIAFPHKLLLICKARVPPLAVAHSCCLVTFLGYINKSGFHFLFLRENTGLFACLCSAWESDIDLCSLLHPGWSVIQTRLRVHVSVMYAE